MQIEPVSGRDGMSGAHSDLTVAEPLITLSRHIPAAIYQYQLFEDGRQAIPYASERIWDIFGVTPKEAMSDATAIFTFVHQEDRDGLIASLYDSARTLTPWLREFRVLLPGRKTNWIEAEATIQQLENDSILWHCFARDISERKTLEDDLREAQDDLVALVEVRTENLTAANKKLAALNKEIQDEILERITLESKLKESYDLLALLTADLVQSEERERRRIAIELHDNVVQHLALGKLRLDMTLQDGVPPQESLETLVNLIVSAMQQIRRICNDLSPPLLYDLGLPHAIESLGERLGREHLFHFTLYGKLKNDQMSDHLRTVLYQTARELLVNVVKHAKAKNVVVHLRAKLGMVQLVVIDDGVGFPPSGGKGFGLSHVQQRIEFLKGKLTITSEPGRKTVVAVVVPLVASAVG